MRSIERWYFHDGRVARVCQPVSTKP